MAPVARWQPPSTMSPTNAQHSANTRTPNSTHPGSLATCREQQPWKTAYPNVTAVSGSFTIRKEWQYRHPCGLIAKPASTRTWRTRTVEWKALASRTPESETGTRIVHTHLPCLCLLESSSGGGLAPPPWRLFAVPCHPAPEQLEKVFV